MRNIRDPGQESIPLHGQLSNVADAERIVPSGQAWSAERYARNGRFVAELGASVVELLAPRAGESILDLGCGDGAFTLMVAASGADVVGLDASPELVSAARERGVRATVGDARALTFERTFDAVVSNAALHWMGDPSPVLAGVARSLRFGGRFVGEFGGRGNVAAIVTALVAISRRHGIDGAAALPWYFPSADEFAARLAANGFAVDTIALVPRPTPLPTGMAAWLETFGASFFSRLSETERTQALAETVELLSHSLRNDDGTWTADYVRLRFSATLGAR